MQPDCKPYGPQFVLPSCSDIAKAAASDATIAALLATAVSVFIVLLLQERLQERKRRSLTEHETRKAVLALLVSTFFSTLLASFSFGILTEEPNSIRVQVLVDVAALMLGVGALQFLSCIGWLLVLYKERETPLTIAWWTLHLTMGISIVYLVLDCIDSVNQRLALPSYVYNGAYIVTFLAAGLLIVIPWVRTKRLKHTISPDASDGREKEAHYALVYAQVTPSIAAGCTVLVGIISDISPDVVQTCSPWFYYGGALVLIAALVSVEFLSELGWPHQRQLRSIPYLKEWVKAKGTTEEELAQQIKLSKELIQKIEIGHEAYIGVVGKLAKGLGISISELEEKPKP